MAQFSKAAVQSYALEARGELDMRIDSTMRGFDAKDAKEQQTALDTVADLKRWFGECADDASMRLMLSCGVDFGFLHTKGLEGKYNVEKVFKLAPYLANVTGKLNIHDLLLFRTLYNFTKANAPCTRQHLKAAIDHTKCDDNDALVYRTKRYGTGTSAPQHGSTLVNFKVWNIVESYTCKDTGAELFKLNVNSTATKAMLARLGLAF